MSLPAASPDQSITLVRVIAAPIEDVFAAWTDPALMTRWMVPILCKIVEASADVRPHGRFRMVIRGPLGLGGLHVISGEYREVVPNRRIVQTWVLEPRKPSAAPYPTLLTVAFRVISAGQTEITLQQDQLKTPADRRGNLAGWTMCLKKLEKLLARLLRQSAAS